MDFQCLLCGATFDGVLHTKPESCPKCDGPESEIVDAETEQIRMRQNEAINKHDEYLEDTDGQH